MEKCCQYGGARFGEVFLGGAVAGLIAGFIAGFVAAILGQADAAAFWGQIAGLIVAIPVSLWDLRASINKHQLRPAQTST